MNKYTIYCTKEQTERAYKLGAPIEPDRAEFSLFNAPTICIGETKGEYGQKVGIYRVCPTVEQMCGWLLSKNLYFCTNHAPQICCITIYEGNYKVPIAEIENFSFDGAIMAAIDAALEYLETNK